jgi:Zn-dependent protease
MMLLGFGWGKSASIDPRNFKTKNPRLGMIAVALAGPLANILLALVIVLAVTICTYAGITNSFVQIFASIALLNIRLAVFLLLPVPGFDGWDILMMFLPVKFIWKIAPYVRYIPLIVILLIYAGPLGTFIDYISMGIISLMSELAASVSGLFFG